MTSTRQTHLCEKSTLAREARDREGGMTLIEIMVVLAIIGLLAATIGVTVMQDWKRSRLRTAELQVREVSGAVEKFMVDRGKCPSLDELVSEHHVRRSPVDPWGTPIVIHCPGEQDPDGVDVLSWGEDRKEGTDDDIKSWKL